MANQPQPLTEPPPRTYTRTDFAALRAFVQKIPAASIARRYYEPDDHPHAASAETMTRYLRTMRDDLVRLALVYGSPVLAGHLKNTIKERGEAKLGSQSLRMVEQAATLAAATPAPDHGVSLWFRPLIAHRLKHAHITTLGELLAYCNGHGASWWRSIPRIGPLRARTLVAWLRRHEATLGALAADVVLTDPLCDPLVADAREVVQITEESRARVLVPLERMALSQALSGRDGVNRATAFCYLAAHHDLDAVRAYLHRYRDRPATLAAYTRELERFVLWAVTVRGKPVSSLLVEDCEAYRDFLSDPAPAFVGPRTSRRSPRWRPFASATLSADSQAYAVRALRAAFAWLVDVRYLAGNPWSAIGDPVTLTRETALDIERALPAALWRKVQHFMQACCKAGALKNLAHNDAEEVQQTRPGTPREVSAGSPEHWRIARAALLMMGDSGLRRAEVANARREQIRLIQHDGLHDPTEPASWALTVIGKAHKTRMVPLSAATMIALREHWQDRGLDFDAAQPVPTQDTHDIRYRPEQDRGGESATALIAPLVIPPTSRAQTRHGGQGRGYSTRGLGVLVTWAMRRALAQMDDLSPAERAQLARTSPHAFRHTFGTQAVAGEVPLDVVQKVLGHASLQTTSVYVKAEQQRVLSELARYHTRLTDHATQPSVGRTGHTRAHLNHQDLHVTPVGRHHDEDLMTENPALWRVRISLLDIEPEIWRSVEIPATLSLARLHAVIQAAMGWDDVHLYSFSIGGQVTDEDHGAHRTRLDTVCRPGDTLGYTYDFGDTWEHAVVIEAEVAAAPRARYPRCIAGGNACPPEDCGGSWAYADLVATLSGGRSAAKTELQEWLGRRFEPHRFSVAQTNARLARAMR